MRVLAVTADASLQVALASMMPDWEMQALSDASAAIDAGDAAVALVDLGTTERGLEAARALAAGLKIPCVVIGENDAEDDCARIVVRPFTLSELGEAVTRAAEEGIARALGVVPAVLPVPAVDIVAASHSEPSPEPSPEPERVEDESFWSGEQQTKAFPKASELEAVGLDWATPVEQDAPKPGTEQKSDEPKRARRGVLKIKRGQKTAAAVSAALETIGEPVAEPIAETQAPEVETEPQTEDGSLATVTALDEVRAALGAQPDTDMREAFDALAEFSGRPVKHTDHQAVDVEPEPVAEQLDALEALAERTVDLQEDPSSTVVDELPEPEPQPEPMPEAEDQAQPVAEQLDALETFAEQTVDLPEQSSSTVVDEQPEPEPAPEPEPEPEPAPAAVVPDRAWPAAALGRVVQLDAPPTPQPAPPPPGDSERTVDYVRALLAEIDLAEPTPVLMPGARVVRERVTRPAPKREIVPEPAPARRGRLRRRPERAPSQRPVPQAQQTGIAGRLSVALWAARDLEALLEEMPVLSEPRAVAHAFLGQIVELFGPETASIYVKRPDGSYSVLAPHGLSQIEAGIHVLVGQPLFREVSSSGNGIFIAPVDLAQGLVAGIGGARTETLMAAPLEAGGNCVAIAVVGASALTEADLTRLCELAAEAAPGLAFALLVERLRARL